ncbi:hypothetical protein CGCTS75_v008622 [Colletotrichum tropicale]|nr:hypothetical protein CGCTS75_v008622 [Colletotrichum tropicale]
MRRRPVSPGLVLRNPRSDGACAPRPSNHQAKGTCQVSCFHAAWSYLHLLTSFLRPCAAQCKGALLQESQYSWQPIARKQRSHRFPATCINTS